MAVFTLFEMTVMPASFFSLKNDPVPPYTSITVLFPVGTCKPC